MKALASPRLGRLEGIIERGQQTFVEVGLALMEIRDSRLYRDAGYSSFDAYCKERWTWNRQRSHQLISAATLVQELSTNVDTLNEGQARELAKAEPDLRDGVLAEATHRAEARGIKVTASLIKEVVSGAPARQGTCTHCEVHCPSGWNGRKG